MLIIYSIHGILSDSIILVTLVEFTVRNLSYRPNIEISGARVFVARNTWRIQTICLRLEVTDMNKERFEKGME